MGENDDKSNDPKGKQGKGPRLVGVPEEDPP